MAQLSGVTDNVATTIVDLNALHSTDWLKYSTGGIITKSGGGSTIAASSGGFDLSSAPIGRTIGWTNGTPTASGSDDNARFDGSPDTFALPADTSVRTVVLYLGTSDFSAGVVQFTIGATLSDGSAAPYSFTTTGPNAPWNITLTYAAASAGQTLNITVTPTTSWAFFSAIGYSTAAAAASVPFTRKQQAFIPADEYPTQRRVRLVTNPFPPRAPSRASQMSAVLRQWEIDSAPRFDRRTRLVIDTPGPPGPLPFTRAIQTDTARRYWDPLPPEEATRRRTNLVFDTPTVTAFVPFSRAARQQALSHWVEPPVGLVLPRRLIRPTLPVMAGLKLWLRGDLGITKDGSNNVFQWDDQSGNGNHAVQGSVVNTPTWQANDIGLNSQSSLSFDTTWFMTGAANVVPSGNARTIFIVHVGGVGTTSGPFQLKTATPFFQVSWASGGANTNMYTDGVGNSQAVPTVSYDAKVIQEIAWDGNTSHDITARLSGYVAPVVHNLGSGTASDTGTAGYVVGVGLSANVGEVIVFDRLLSAAEGLAVRQYLATRYFVDLIDQPTPFGQRQAQIELLRRSWEPELPTRFDRRFAPPFTAPQIDSPIPGWNRRLSNLIARQAWETPDWLPSVLRRSGISKFVAPNGVVTPPLLAFVGLVELTLAEIGGPTQIVVATIDLTMAEVGGPSQLVIHDDALTLKGDT